VRSLRATHGADQSHVGIRGQWDQGDGLMWRNDENAHLKFLQQQTAVQEGRKDTNNAGEEEVTDELAKAMQDLFLKTLLPEEHAQRQKLLGLVGNRFSLCSNSIKHDIATFSETPTHTRRASHSRQEHSRASLSSVHSAKDPQLLSMSTAMSPDTLGLSAAKTIKGLWSEHHPSPTQSSEARGTTTGGQQKGASTRGGLGGNGGGGGGGKRRPTTAGDCGVQMMQMPLGIRPHSSGNVACLPSQHKHSLHIDPRTLPRALQNPQVLCIHVYMRKCMYIHIHIYIHTHTQT